MSAPLRARTPLHIPELGPSLGRLIVPRRRHEPWIPIDDIREELATAVLELAGAGRAAAQQADLGRIAHAMGPEVWLRAWEGAVRRVAERVAGRVDAEIEFAARRVRMPHRRWKRQLLTAGERRAVAARLAAAGGPFVEATDELAFAAERLRASGTDAAVTAQWDESLRGVARRLEAAWLALEEEIELERRRWRPEFDLISDWRPSLLPVVALWLPAAAVLIWLGLALGGFAPAPPWLARLLGF
jgi:hypothetical protein